MKQFATTLTIGACLMMGASFAQAENRALLIGIGPAYGKLGKPLNGPEKDVSLAGQLAKKMGFEESEIKYLREEKATRNAIMSGLQWVKDGVKGGGRAFIYYSGHGTQVPDARNECAQAWVPADTEQTRSGFKNLVLDKEIGGALNQMGNAQVLVISDSCFSGAITKAFDLASDNTKFINPKSANISKVCGNAVNLASKGIGISREIEEKKLVEFTATTSNEVAYADVTRLGRGSLFTQAIYDAVSENPGASLAVLRDSVVAQVQKMSAENQLVPHHPQLNGNQGMFAMNLNFEQTGETYHGGVENAHNNRELVERVAKDSTFPVAIVVRDTTLKLHDKINFSVKTSQSGFLNIVQVDENDEMSVLFPNKYAENNKISVGRKMRIPEDIGGFRFRATSAGDSTILALVTKEPLNLYKMDAGENNGAFKIFGKNDFSRLLNTFVSKTVNKRGKGLSVEKEEQNEYGAMHVVITVK